MKDCINCPKGGFQAPAWFAGSFQEWIDQPLEIKETAQLCESCNNPNYEDDEEGLNGEEFCVE